MASKCELTAWQNGNGVKCLIAQNLPLSPFSLKDFNGVPGSDFTTESVLPFGARCFLDCCCSGWIVQLRGLQPSARPWSCERAQPELLPNRGKEIITDNFQSLVSVGHIFVNGFKASALRTVLGTKQETIIDTYTRL